MKTTTKPANRFRRPVSVIITCMGPLLASCGTGPSATTTSQPVALLSEYKLRSWHDVPGHINKEADARRSLRFSKGMENGVLTAGSMITKTPDDSRRGSEFTMDLYGDVARATKLTSSVLLEPDESMQIPESGMIATGFWHEQASR